MHDQQSFFEWQEAMLGWLLRWGVVSAVVGAGLAGSDDEIVHQIGLQGVAWGVIDLLIAVGARSGTRRQAQSSQADQVEAAATRFERIVAINTVLDMGYVVGGAWIARGTPASRKGIGRGIMLQGSFLACYDMLLWQGVRRWLSR